MNLIKKENYQLIVFNYLNRLYAHGLSQVQIANYLGVSDRAIRKWECCNSVPSGVQFLNLKRLCKELGA